MFGVYHVPCTGNKYGNTWTLVKPVQWACRQLNVNAGSQRHLVAFMKIAEELEEPWISTEQERRYLNGQGVLPKEEIWDIRQWNKCEDGPDRLVAIRVHPEFQKTTPTFQAAVKTALTEVYDSGTWLVPWDPSE